MTSGGIAADEVHVWRCALDMPDERVAALEGLLDEAERARAARFYFDRDRRRFIVSHGALRSVLSLYLRHDPRAIRFRQGPRRKPFLAGDPAPSLRFNLAHSGERALVAVALNREIGVDIEMIKEQRAIRDIANRFFSPYEVGVLLALPEQERTAAFYRLWARKEAYLKARGDGLGLPLDSFDITLAPRDPPALLQTRYDPADAARWTLQDVPVEPGYAAAVAVQGAGWHLRVRIWGEDGLGPPASGGRQGCRRSQDRSPEQVPTNDPG